MYKNLVLLLLLSFSVGAYAQFGSLERSIRKKTERKFRKEGEKKAEEGIDKGVDAAFHEADKGLQAAEAEEQKFYDWAEEEFADEAVFIDENLIDANNIQWQRLRFNTGTDIIFYDKPFNYEKEDDAPSNWIIKYRSSTEIADFDQGRMIIVGGEGFITPKMPNIKQDYMPENFTVEFDFMMPVVPFSKPMEVNFYAKNQQSEEGFAPIKINKNLITYKDSTQTYPVLYSDEDGMGQWYRCSILFNDGLLKIYMNERLMISYQEDFNPTGFSIEYMAYSPIFFKNFIIATNPQSIEDQLNNGKYVSYNIDYVSYKELLTGRSISELAPIANMLNAHPEMEIEAEVYFSQHDKEKANKEFGKKKAEDIVLALVSMGASENQIKATYKGSIKSSKGNKDNYKSEMVVFRKK